MNATIQTIPELLVSTFGNMTEVARRLNANRATVTKYARDRKGEFHAVVNGVLMTHHGKWRTRGKGSKSCDKE